jgi:hypothetical protein
MRSSCSKGPRASKSPLCRTRLFNVFHHAADEGLAFRIAKQSTSHSMALIKAMTSTRVNRC